MTRQSVTLVLVFALLSISALAQTGTAPSRPTSPPATTPARPAPATGTASAAAANAPAGTRIGVINIQAAIMASNEGQRDFNVLQKKFEPKQAELQSLSKELEDLKKQLNTQGDKLNDETRANLMKSIEQKQKVFQRNYEDARQEVDAAQQELFNKIGSKILEVLDTYAKNNGYAVIIDVSNPQTPVLWAGPQYNVTQEVVTAYNAVSGVPAPPPPAPSAAKPAGSGTTTAGPAQPPKTTTGSTPRNPQ